MGLGTKQRRQAARARAFGQYRVEWVVPKRDPLVGSLDKITEALVSRYGGSQPVMKTSTGYLVVAYDRTSDVEPVVLARVTRPGSVVVGCP